MDFRCLRFTAVMLAVSLTIASGGRADSTVKGAFNFAPDRTAVAVLVATKGNATAAGLEISASTLLMNGAIHARSWSRTEREGSSKNDLGVFLGVGLADILQIQAGHSSETGFALRLRSGIPVTPTAHSWAEFNKGRYWTITPLVEIPVTAHHGTVFGVGVGFTF
jgi:hypothetical protein